MQYLTDFIALMMDRRVSLSSKLFVVAAVGAYIVLPIDLIPDFLLPLGVVDDGGIILAAIVAFTRQARKQVAAEPIAAIANGDSIDMPAAQPLRAAESDSPVISAASPAASPAAPQATHTQQPSGGMSCGCLSLVAMFVVAPFVGVAILLLSTGFTLSGIVGPVFDLFDFPTTANIVSSRTIVNSLRGLGQLVTVRGEFATTDLLVSVDEGFLNSGYHSANHVALGSIEAGVDLTQFDRDDVRFDAATGSMYLTLPPPIITSCNIEHIDQNTYSVSILQKDWDTIRQMAEYDALLQYREDAQEGGILEEAQEEIRYRLGTFLNTLTGAPVHIDFAGTVEEKFGDTCYPDLPSGWQKDEDGKWMKTD